MVSENSYLLFSLKKELNVTHIKRKIPHTESTNYPHVLIVQGGFFNWTPPKLSKYKFLYNLWHSELIYMGSCT